MNKKRAIQRVVADLTPATARALLLLTKRPQLERRLLERGTTANTLGGLDRPVGCWGWGRIAGYIEAPGSNPRSFSGPMCDQFSWFLKPSGVRIKAAAKRAGWYLVDVEDGR